MDAHGVLEKFRRLKEERERAMDLKPEVEDKKLISLQRTRQKQLNEVEKARLAKAIGVYEKQKFRKNFGIKGKQGDFSSKFNKKDSFLVDKKPLLKSKPKHIKSIFK